MKEKKGLVSLCSSQIFKSDWKILLCSEEGALFFLLIAAMNHNFVVKTSPRNCHSKSKFREFASFDSPSLFLRHPEHTQDLQHISESNFHGIQCSVCLISLHSREGWAGGQCTSVGRSPWIWGQTGNLGSKEEVCSPAALEQSTKEQVSIAWSREVGSPPNHQPFPLRAAVVLALCFLSLN